MEVDLMIEALSLPRPSERPPARTGRPREKVKLADYRSVIATRNAFAAFARPRRRRRRRKRSRLRRRW